MTQILCSTSYGTGKKTGGDIVTTDRGVEIAFQITWNITCTANGPDGADCPGTCWSPKGVEGPHNFWASINSVFTDRRMQKALWRCGKDNECRRKYLGEMFDIYPNHMDELNQNILGLIDISGMTPLRNVCVCTYGEQPVCDNLCEFETQKEVRALNDAWSKRAMAN
tara:strand:+ start:721 stop:1221 length:501 start_codon:yes stop_codon:yes gene_type:complete